MRLRCASNPELVPWGQGQLDREAVFGFCCVAWRPSGLQAVGDLLLGGTQAELLLHHLDEQGPISFGQDDPV